MSEREIRRRVKLDRRGDRIAILRWRPTTTDYRMWRLPRGVVRTISVDAGSDALLPVLDELLSIRNDSADVPVQANDVGDFSELMKPLGCRTRRQFYSEVVEIVLASGPGLSVVLMTSMVRAEDGRGFVEDSHDELEVSTRTRAAEFIWERLVAERAES